MPDVITTVGGATSNSYVTLLEADTYFDSAFGKSMWIDAYEEVKEQLVISASAALDAYIKWSGQRYSIDQAMDWPRVNAYDRDRMMYSYTSIPYTIKVAVFELAYHLMVNGGLTYEQNKIDEVKVGSIGIKFSNYVTETGIPKYIESMLAHVGVPLFISDGTIKMVSLVRS